MTFARIGTLSALMGLLLFSTPTLAQSTEEVLTHHLSAFGAGDVDAIMADYAEGAVVVNEAGVMKGHDEIRPLFEAFVAEFSKPGTTFEMIDQKVEGELAYIVWSAETADNVYEYATDTFVIHDGKIVYQTLAGVTSAK